MKKRDYLTGFELSAAQTLELIEEALVQKKETAQGKLRPALAGKNFALIFEKHSTRTRVSFEAGLTQLGASTIFLAPNDTQIARGETPADSARVLSEYVDGIVADLGISSFQLERSGKGFSFNRNEFLDMRMDAGLQFSAYDLVNEMRGEELEYILRKYGEEKFARRIANSIVKSRTKKPIQTSFELASIISNSIPKKFHPKKTHPATKTFQALRISINNELDNLAIFIEEAVKILNTGARLVIISFHSLEDRIVKNMFRKLDSPCACPPDLPVCACGKFQQVRRVTRSVVRPGRREVEENPKARSSKMRVAEGV